MNRPQRYLDTMWNLRYRHCGDNRDRVYALISMIPVKVKVEYERPVVEIYTRVHERATPKKRHQGVAVGRHLGPKETAFNP